MKKIILAIVVVLCIGFVSSDVQSVFAQEEEGSEAFVLEEITVTATKREENLQKVAISGTSVAGDALERAAKLTINDMLRDTAGVEIRGSSNEPTFFIRGVGRNTAGMAVEGNVSFSFNSVPLTATKSNRVSYHDIARIEVTRGPDSTMNGRSAAGGSINIITNEPTHTFEGSGSVQVGNYDFYSTQGVINVPIGEQFALRSSAISTKRDGLLSNGQNDLDNFGSRFRGLWEPNDKLKAILSMEYNLTGGKGRGMNAYTTPIDLSKPFTTPRGAFYNPTEAPFSEDVKDYTYFADITYDFGWATFYFQPTYQTMSAILIQYGREYAPGSTDPDPDTWSSTFFNREQTQETYEVRLTSPDEGPMNWLAGAYYLDLVEIQAINFGPRNATELPPPQYLKLTPQSTRRFKKDKSVYGQVNYSFTDSLSLSVGARYTKVENYRPYASSPTWFYVLDDGFPNSTTGERVYYATQEETNTVDRMDYKISLQKDLASNSMVYALVSTGFKGGGFNLLPNDNPEIIVPGYSPAYGPEFLTSYEIGTKNQFLENRLRLNASAFFYNYQDIQLSFQGTPIKLSTGVDPDWTRGLIQNGGEGESYGAEIETDYLITGRNRIKLNISYLHTEFTDMKFEPLYYLKGTEMAQSPNWRLSSSYQHRFELGVSGHCVAEIYGSYVTDAIYQIASTPVSPYNKRDAYFKADATLTYYTSDGQWSFSGYVRNMFDEQTYDNVSLPRVYFGYSNVQFQPADPRTFGATLSAHF